MKWEYGVDDKGDFIKTFEQGVNFGGWDDSKLSVIVQGEDIGETMEGHLFCDPNADTSLLAATISYGVKEVLKFKRNILIETPAKHRTLRQMLSRIGFQDLGLSAYRRRAVETSFYLYG